MLTWNPKVFAWEDIQESIAEVEEFGDLVIDWSCGRAKKIRAGDRVFLSRQGVEPKGTMASGTVVVGVYTEKHFDTQKPGKTSEANYVQFSYEILLDPGQTPLLSREVLRAHLPETNCDTQMSGMAIKEGAAARLEERWNEHLKELGYEPIPEEGEEG